MTRHIVGDISKLPACGFRTHGLWGWATLGFMVMEGAGFALACAAYVYLMHGAERWPLNNPPPNLFWGTLQTLLLVGSLVPNKILSIASRKRDLNTTRLWAVVLALLNLLVIAVRAFEFPNLNARWDFDAYGSVVWALMLLHTLHILTDFIDTGFLTVFLFTHSVDDERFADVDDDTIYWAFVVATWIPIYLLVYWSPRWLP